MTEYTYSIDGRTCHIRNARTGVSIRQLTAPAPIKNVCISGETASLITEHKTYVMNIKNGITIRQV